MPSFNHKSVMLITYNPDNISEKIFKVKITAIREQFEKITHLRSSSHILDDILLDWKPMQAYNGGFCCGSLARVRKNT